VLGRRGTSSPDTSRALCTSAHPYRQWEGKCSSASEDGTMWQRCFTVVLPKWHRLSIPPMAKGRKTEGFIKLS